MTPISTRPCTLPMASRKASSAAGSGIASRAVRAHDVNWGSARSGASTGTRVLCAVEHQMLARDRLLRSRGVRLQHRGSV